MKTFKISRIIKRTDNTAENGFGDYYTTLYKEIDVVKAKSLRSLSYKFKKDYDSNARFGGNFPNYIVKELTNCENCGSKLGIDCGDAEQDFNEKFCSFGCNVEYINKLSK